MKKFILLCFFTTYIFAKPIISVSIPPLEYFVQKIAGTSVEIHTLLPDNADEHTFEPKPQSLLTLEKSKIYFTIGLEFERPMLNKFQSLFKQTKIINLNDNIPLIEKKHSHAHEGHELHSKDPHTWLDPILVKSQAKTIAKALIEQFPQNKKMYEENLTLFEKELDSINETIKTKLQDIKHNNFIVYHPSWSYFAKRYNLTQIPVEVDGKEPKPKALMNLIQIAKEKNIKVIFVQAGFAQNASALLAKELNANVVQINHLSKDWQNELLKSVNALENSLK
ncbi:zinc ABC transporter substrate-binding protein [Campylobacter jejuni]|nr:zinc ABC transporter substrate-binding protein [Campylobacter jejuni]